MRKNKTSLQRNATPPPSKKLDFRSTVRFSAFSLFLFIFVFCALTCAAPARAEITAVEPPTDANGVYQISTAGHLVFFRNLVNDMDGQTQTSGANAVLLADINIAGEENWTPIGTAPYAGTFDGGGHTISGLQVNRALYVGLFGNIFGGTVKNLTVETAARRVRSPPFQGATPPA